MGFDPMTPDEIQAYLGVIGDKAEAISVILTDGAMLTGRYSIRDDPSQPLSLYALSNSVLYRAKIPANRIAGILEQNPVGAKAPDPSLLVPPAERAGLGVDETFVARIMEPGSAWAQAERIQYKARTMLYFDAAAISARSGGINAIGGGCAVASVSLGWQAKLVGKAVGRLKRHIFEVGSHCAARRSDLTLKGYVEFFDVSKAKPSSGGGPLLEVEGALWTAAFVWRSPAAGRGSNDPWALCYFRQDCMGLGPASWERIVQPLRIYGDMQPHEQTMKLGVAQCYLKVRAAACFPRDK